MLKFLSAELWQYIRIVEIQILYLDYKHKYKWQYIENESSCNPNHRLTRAAHRKMLHSNDDENDNEDFSSPSCNEYDASSSISISIYIYR